jgi:hypothetical protein
MKPSFTIGGFAAHPTKGFRAFCRPAGTNRRRRLIRTGELMLPDCHEENRRRRYYKSGRWPKMSLPERQMMKARGWS